MAGSANSGDVETQDKLNPPRLAAAMLNAAAWVLGVVATAWALARFYEISRAPQPATSEFLAVAVELIAAWAFGVLLWGAATILRRLENLRETLSVVARSGRPDPPPLPRSRDAASTEKEGRLLEELVRLTRDVRDIELLSDDERAMRLQNEGAVLTRELEAAVPQLLREHNWVEAQRRVRAARVRFPALPNWDALEQQVEAARANVESRDVEALAREIDDLAALGAWDRAAEAVRDLQHRHPNSQRVAELAKRVATGRAAAAAEERARLMAQAQEATNDREWALALDRVGRVIARWPDSPEAHDLRLQLPTLRANLEIQERQRMEVQIRDLIKEHRFPDALRVARALIERYPDSPQAEVLRDQLPRLEEKAGPQASR